MSAETERELVAAADAYLVALSEPWPHFPGVPGHEEAAQREWRARQSTALERLRAALERSREAA